MSAAATFVRFKAPAAHSAPSRVMNLDEGDFKELFLRAVVDDFCIRRLGLDFEV
jgi:hypothetical protein